jgi:hypothetical protein
MDKEEGFDKIIKDKMIVPPTPGRNDFVEESQLFGKRFDNPDRDRYFSKLPAFMPTGRQTGEAQGPVDR